MTNRFLALLALAAGFAVGQNSPTLQVTGAVKQPLTLTAADLAKMPRASVHVTIHGVEATYEGVWLHEVLKVAGVPEGKDLRGKAMTTYVLATAKDGYQVVFSLAELDPYFIDNQVLLADAADGKALEGELGPFRIIVPKDKPAARSIRMLTSLEIVRLRK